YNTGTDGFVYRDKFSFTADDLQEKLGISEEQANRILAMTSRGAASHSAWLTFMMPRLMYAKDLLSDDGVIFISIDDNEQANLKLLCDYVFGEENMIACFCKKGTGGRQDSSHFAKIHEYVMCYAKPLFEAGEELKGEERYPYSDEYGKYKTVLLRKWGDAALRSDRPNMFYPIYFNGVEYSLNDNLEGNVVAVYPMLDSKTEGRWRWGMDTMEEAIKHGLIEIKLVDGGNVAYEKVYEPSDDEIPTKLFNTWIDNVNNQTGKNLLKELFDGEAPFEYPKPLDLIKKIIKMGNAVDGIIVDFFSGSATTAHAVMQMNAEDHDHRKYILVQWQEVCKENSAAARMGFATIDQLGQERIRRAAAKIKAETNADIDYGFKHYTLEEPDDNTLDRMERFVPTDAFGENLLDAFGKDTVLATYAVRDGYGLTPTIEPVRLGGYTAYLCGKHLYMIEPEFNVYGDDLTELVDTFNKDNSFAADTVVLFGYSFSFSQTDAIKKNLGAIAGRSRINIDIRY
ncbi:MAG TPA: site-specific DNA-methyltransferase, partial [Candidatus Prevotella stercoripullorum]|nr:site-specific DNA-methyltransferase [Candidatus Prevotella stercoripullorum]